MKRLGIRASAVLLGVALILWPSGVATASEIRTVSLPDEPVIITPTEITPVDLKLVHRPFSAALLNCPDGACIAFDFEREVLAGDVVHYRVKLQVGPGEYDVIGLHRVIKEKRPYRPVKAKQALFLVHGDGAPFASAFLAGTLSPSVPVSHSLPFYLAENGIDVWGIDLSWTLVPQGITDFTFMAEWGLQRDVDHVKIGLSVAQAARVLTGSGASKLHLSGWSRGGWTGYALLGEESQLPTGHRLVKGYIPVDTLFKIDPVHEDRRQWFCADVAGLDGLLAAGVYQDESGVLVTTISFLAKTAPADPSPIIPGLTNLQTALFFGVATFNLSEPVPYYHLVAGIFDEFGIPAGLQYTSVDLWVDFMGGWAPYEPILMMRDTEAVSCDEEDSPFDDHLADITVPIMYVGAEGGFGSYGNFSTTVTGSSDATIHVVSLYPPEARVLDFAHVDIFAADNAETLVWEPILNWIEDH